MGVKALWRLLLPIGRRISIETLEGKILAIDASIWLTQFLKAMRDPDTGSVKPAAHLIGFFRRLAKLRFHGIRPVLVFDGATPEIKKREVQQRQQRREQFALTGQAGIQRLAKRLLFEQLKKGKALKNGTGNGGGGAYAPGFQPAEEDEPPKEDAPEESSGKKPAATIDICHEAIMAEVAGLEEEWKEQENIEAENDWDNAVIESTSEQQEKPSSIYNCTYNTFDVKRISSLPSHQRKDAVEEAKRQQRMRSRREFMPVAGKPAEYSQVQLQNFLRSSRLNKEINEMAEQAAGKDDGVGEPMASDATRRIILTKDDDTDEGQNPWKRLRKRASSFRTSKLPPAEDDEEFEWEDGKTATASLVNGIKDTLSERDTSTYIRTNVAFAALDGNDGGDESAGGFLPSDALATSAAKAAQVIRIDSEESDGDEVGGFITAAHARDSGVTASNPVIEIDDAESGDGFFPQPPSDARRAQELEDEMLARALQETEREPPGAAQAGEAKEAQQSGEYSKEIKLQIDRDASLATSLQETETVNQQNDFGTIDESLDVESDNVDWEDGDHDDGGSRHDEESNKTLACVAGGRVPFAVPESSSNQRLATDEESDSDDVAWEDGEKETKTSPAASNARNGVDQPALESIVTDLRDSFHPRLTNGNANNYKDNETPCQSPSISVDEHGVSKSAVEMNDYSDIVQILDENTLALEHAQATAANLTNWAGRAFRRAMAQHAEETGTMSPEKASHNSVAETQASTTDKKDDKNDTVVEVLGDELQRSSGRKQAASTIAHNRTPPVQAGPSPNRAAPSDCANVGGSTVPHQSFLGLHQDIASSLQEQIDMLDADTRRQERDMDTITDEMKAEVIQLIKLFGIPYVESPAEAEAQCAKLEELGLVDGIVTEDSDVFVFGGKTVYKNIFDDQKYVEAYLASDAQRDLALDRNKMVALAMLLGGDYSEGVKGVGIVNGMEVLQAFDCSSSVKEGLTKFRKWLDGFDPDDVLKNKSDDLSAEEEFRLKHKTARTQWVAPKHFPAENVINAYMKPVVDSSNDRFSWGTPDLDRLLAFCKRSMGWDYDETRKLLEPVVQRLEDTSRQTRLESFFMKYEDDIKFAKVKSKRLRAVFEDIQKEQSSEEAKKVQKKRAKTKSN